MTPNQIPVALFVVFGLSLVITAAFGLVVLVAYVLKCSESDSKSTIVSAQADSLRHTRECFQLYCSRNHARWVANPRPKLGAAPAYLEVTTTLDDCQVKLHLTKHQLETAVHVAHRNAEDWSKT